MVGFPSPIRAPKPVFLHGLWRSGSTYVWSKFRAAPQACAFYEPDHHGLARLTRGRIPRDGPDRFAANNHPLLDRPYFAEYEPLLAWRGVKRFRSHFGFDRFVLDSRAQHRGFESYLRLLVEHARAEGLSPVLGFNRTMLRIGWLKSRFGSTDIHWDRDPYGLWRSYTTHLEAGNYSFFIYWMKVLERNAAHPLLAPLAQRLPLRGSRRELTRGGKAYYRRALDRMPPEMTYAIVVYVWTLAALHALSVCDLVVDMNRLHHLPYARDVAADIRRQTGFELDFGDARPLDRHFGNEIGDAKGVESAVLALIPKDALAGLVDAEGLRTRLDALTDRKSGLLHHVL